MIWLLYFPLNIVCMLLCYITNPIVVLFADNVGELKGFLHYWQTWDDSLDSKFMMTEVVPQKYKFLDYDWDSKYEAYQDFDTLKEYNKVIDKVRLKEGAHFNIKERIQRYFCRLLWLYRNCGYGFAFNLFGTTGSLDRLKIDKIDDENFSAYDVSEDALVFPWTLKFTERLFKNIYICGYLGWKIPIWQEQGNLYKCMIVNRIVFRRNKG